MRQARAAAFAQDDGAIAVERKALLRIDERQLGSANAVGLHLLKLAKNLRLLDRGAEPPPADHWSGAGWGIGKVLPQDLKRH